MNNFVLVLTCILSNSLWGMQKVTHSETLVPGGKSAITSYLHILPKDVEELIAQQLICAHPALFSQFSPVLSGSVALTADGKWAVTGSWDKTALLWDLTNSGSSPRVLSGHNDAIRSVALTPDGKWVITGSGDSTVRLWDIVNSDSSPRVLSGHADGIVAVGLTPDGKWALTGSYDTTAQLWDLGNSGSSPRVLSGHTEAIFSVVLSPDGRWL